MLKHSLQCQGNVGTHRMDYLEFGRRDSDRFPIICVHGLARNADDFVPLATALADTHWVICPHIAGRGSSEWLKDPAGYSYETYAADLLTLIAHLNVTAVDWLGTSMGGILGMILAAMPNSPIQRLMLNDVGAFIPLAALQRIATYLGKDPAFATIAEVEDYLRRTYAGFGTLSDAQWRNMAQSSARPLPDGRYGLAYDPAIADPFSQIQTDIDLWPVYDANHCPTKLLRGATSDILTAETAQAMTQRGPKARLTTITNCGHAPALMDEAQIQLVRDFFTGDYSTTAQSPSPNK